MPSDPTTTPADVLDDGWITVTASDGLPSLRAKTGEEHIAALEAAGYKIVATAPDLAERLDAMTQLDLEDLRLNFTHAERADLRRAAEAFTPAPDTTPEATR